MRSVEMQAMNGEEGRTGAYLVGDDGHIQAAVGGVDCRDNANDDDDWPPHRADHSLEQITYTTETTAVGMTSGLCQ